MTATTRTPTVKVTTEKITPDQAAAWLEQNTHNRRLRDSEVQRLAAAIQRGEWVLNGDAIRFAADGSLLDGQHRLWAILTAETTVESVVIRGLPNQAQETMDQGARRNLGDVLRLRGYTSSSALAAGVSYWWRYENGYVRAKGQRPTIPQAIATLEAHPTLVEAVQEAEPCQRLLRMPRGVMTACIYEFRSIDNDLADRFLDRLRTGINLTEGDPVLALRRYLEQHRDTGGVDPVNLHALTIKAWNACRSGVKVERLSWKATGMKAEGFPEAE